MFDFSADKLAKAFSEIAQDGCERVCVRVEGKNIIVYEPVMGLHYHIVGSDADLNHSAHHDASD